MSIKINDLNVDEAYSPIVEKALFEDIVLIPGVTYTDKFVEIAGKVYVHKETTTTRTAKKIGSSFTSEDAEDDLVEITIDQELSFDKKIYGVQTATVKYDVVASQIDIGSKELATAKQALGLATMAKEATNYGTYTAITDSNVKATFVGIRKKLRDAKSNADFWIVNTSTYGAILADKSNFAPNTNDETLRSGIVGYYLGAPVLEANALSQTVKGYGWAKGVDLSKVEVIAGKGDALAINEVLSALRAKDSENFVGIRAQGQLDLGFKVVNPAKLVVKTTQADILVTVE